MQKTSEVNNIIKEFAEPSVVEAMNSLLDSQEKSAIISAALVLAEQFGADKNFKSIIESESSTECEQKLVTSFHNNLKLLVQKTWVEKADEAIKEQVSFRLDNFCKDYAENTNPSYTDFVILLKDVVYLMFGAQSRNADFTEYALRIDPAFGIFWWYLISLPEEAPESVKKMRVFFLLGMIFLANY